MPIHCYATPNYYRYKYLKENLQIADNYYFDTGGELLGTYCV